MEGSRTGRERPPDTGIKLTQSWLPVGKELATKSQILPVEKLAEGCVAQFIQRTLENHGKIKRGVIKTAPVSVRTDFQGWVLRQASGSQEFGTSSLEHPYPPHSSLS